MTIVGAFIGGVAFAALCLAIACTRGVVLTNDDEISTGCEPLDSKDVA